MLLKMTCLNPLFMAQLAMRFEDMLFMIISSMSGYRIRLDFLIAHDAHLEMLLICLASVYVIFRISYKVLVL